jgi:competence protein ComEA
MGRDSMRAVAIGVLSLSGGVLIASSAVHAASQAPQAAPDASKANSQYARLPEGPGKDTLIRVCGKCHSPMNVVANGQSRDGWEAEITKMAGLGASASDEEFTAILDYVTKNFPPATEKVNINKATAADLESQLGLTDKQAAAIVDYRTRNGDFKTIDDVMKVPGLAAMDVNSRKNRISF